MCQSFVHSLTSSPTSPSFTSFHSVPPPYCVMLYLRGSSITFYFVFSTSIGVDASFFVAYLYWFHIFALALSFSQAYENAPSMVSRQPVKSMSCPPYHIHFIVVVIFNTGSVWGDLIWKLSQYFFLHTSTLVFQHTFISFL